MLIYSENAFAGVPPDSPIGNFGNLTTLVEAEKMVVNLKIKLPDSSTLPEGYSLQAVLIKPIGEETRETFSDRMFRPEMLNLYYSNNPVNGSMFVSEHPEWIIITESYSLGSNSTRPYTENREIPPEVTVGWFFGYPGYMRGGTILVYQFEEEMAYQLYSTFLTQEEMLVITKSLIENKSIIKTTTTTRTTTTTKINSTTLTNTTISSLDFASAVQHANNDAFKVVITWGNENTIVLNDSDPRFEELLLHLNYPTETKSYLKKFLNGVSVPSSYNVSIPSPWDYELTFELGDGSSVLFIHESDNIWFDTDQRLYQASFTSVLTTFLNNLTEEKESVSQSTEIIYSTAIIMVIAIIVTAVILRKRR